MTPSRYALYWFGGWLALGIGAALSTGLVLIWQTTGILLTALFAADALLVSREGDLQFSRQLKHTLALGTWHEIGLLIHNPSTHSPRCIVHDHYPSGFDVEEMPRTVDLFAGGVTRIRYRLRPQQRGTATFPFVDLLFASPLRFWRRHCRYEQTDTVRVYPNFAEISHYTMLATDNRLSQIGVRRKQRRGEGNDFHQLREYRLGDSLRQIEWKATARYQKLISKEYQDERDQQILFLLDCGRRMRHLDDNRAHLDQALNAMLLLSYVAIQQGDAVGFLSFAGTRRWFPPRKGTATVSKLLNHTYDLQSSTEPADYMMAAQELTPLQRKRALLIILTSTRDEEHEDLQAAVSLLRRRHLVVVADLREEIIDENLQAPLMGIDDALRFHAINDYLETRRKSHETLAHQGAMILDLLPKQLPIALVNQYLVIKRMGSL